MSSREREQIEAALREVIDPELGINIVDLGLVYRIEFGKGRIGVQMTMTSPACPLGETVRDAVEASIRRHVPAAEEVRVDLVWDPPWSPERMSAAARRHLGWKDAD